MNNKNPNPPHAMLNVPRSSGQLEHLVRLRFVNLFLAKIILGANTITRATTNFFCWWLRAKRLCAKWVRPPFHKNIFTGGRTDVHTF